MAKTNIISDVKSIMYLRLMEFKNSIMEILKHPIRAIIELSKFIIPIIFAFFPLIFNTKKTGKLITIDSSTMNVIGAIVMIVLIIIFFMNLYKAVIKYYPIQYSQADVNFLFVSPISSRTIYSFSIAKQIFISFLGSFILMIPITVILKSLNILISNLGILWASIGIAFFIIVVKTLNFFLYSVSKRFHIAFLIEKVVIVFIAIVALYFGISLYKSGDIMKNVIIILGGETFELIPIIGWTKELILSGFTGMISIEPLIKMSVFIVLMMFITIYFATDYYEEAIVSVERASALKNNNFKEVKSNPINKKKIKSVNVGWNLKREYAFLWKALIINKRKSRGTTASVLKYVLFAAIGGIAVWFILKKIEVSIFVFGAASLLSIMGLLKISEILFNRMEIIKD